MTTMEKRYLISGRAPTQLRLSDFGITRQPGAQDAEIETRIRCSLSLTEFHRIFGDDANIIHFMVHDTETRDNWTATIGVEEILACENHRSMQRVIIDALRAREGMPPFTAEQTEQHALGYADISPDVALFLMQMYDNAHDPADVDVESELARFDAAAFILSDVCHAAGSPPP